MCEDHILSFLSRSEIRELIARKDNHGFTALHYALRILRPAICDVLLSHGADILEPDPDGHTALHHIARQCLRTEVDLKGRINYTSFRTTGEYVQACSALWDRYLAVGGSLDVLDSKKQSPIFQYFSGNCGYQHLVGPKQKLDMTRHEDCLHYQYFDVFFGQATWQEENAEQLREALILRGDQITVHDVMLFRHVGKRLGMSC
jgi:hypothetical protein